MLELKNIKGENQRKFGKSLNFKRSSKKVTVIFLTCFKIKQDPEKSFQTLKKSFFFY